MTDFVNMFFEERLEKLLDLAASVERVFSSAGLEYRIIGGLAAYLYVEEREPDAGRLTKNIDIAVCRTDLEDIANAAVSFGLHYRHVAGVDMLVQADQPFGRRAIHLYPKAVPELGPDRLDEAGLITPEVEAVRRFSQSVWLGPARG